MIFFDVINDGSLLELQVPAIHPILMTHISNTNGIDEEKHDKIINLYSNI